MNSLYCYPKNESANQSRTAGIYSSVTGLKSVMLSYLLDVTLPGMDGWEVLHEVRCRSACPVIMLRGNNAFHPK
ncbi:hypothetical protein [Paenibacillus sp. sptzw28]|uniref:hypothetical protein n=1 Tax=Paenibacillus sp. sptzw28 TaxID=715179 RepID=UPI0021612FE9|nr:hypothetical protein [Paenibacillus sp. sptzw28]